MTWLIVGGAGYIGSHVVRRLAAAGLHPVVLDDMSSGDPARVPDGVPLIVASCDDQEAVSSALRRYGVTGVVHLAGRKSAPESVAHPLHYYKQNVEGMRVLLSAMIDFGVSRMLMSSSAAVYGVPPQATVTEETPPAPINPYGETKLMCEWVLRSVGTAYGLSWIALRYFNVVGSDDAVLADRSRASLFPLAFREVAAGRPVTVTGADFPTRDGSGIRDYIHVADVADAHIAAVLRLERGPAADVYNVGTGRGYSVFEVLNEVRAVTGRDVAANVVARRPGDPPEVLAGVEKIGRELGWRARHNLTDMVRSTWETWDVPVGTPV